MECWRLERGLGPCGSDAVLLTLPDIRQQTDHDCGAAALRAVLEYHGIQPARWLKRLANPVQGMAPDTIEAVMWEAFGHVSRGTMTVADLQHFANTRRPVLCPITVDGMGHWVAVRGVAHRYVHFHDPSTGPRSLSLPAWRTAWTDYTPGTQYRNFGLVGWPE